MPRLLAPSRELTTRMCSVVLGLFALSATPAQAKERVDVNWHGEGGLLDLPRAGSLGPGRYSFGAWGSYDRGDDGQQRFHAAPLSFGLGLPYRLEAAFSFTNRDERDPLRPGVAPRLATSFKLTLAQSSPWPWVALAVRLDDVFSLPRITPLLAVDAVFGWTTLVAVGGYELVLDKEGDDDGHALRFGGGLQQRLTSWLVLQGEAAGRHRRLHRPQFIFSGAARVHLYQDLGLVVGASVGRSSPTGLRLMVGLRYVPTAGGLGDTDQDGVLDRNDRCPEEAEDRDGFRDGDGCPDPDNDGDGIPDEVDQTPDGAPRSGRHSKRPVRMRLRIPQGAIPVWIMRNAANPRPSRRPPARQP